MKNKYTNDSISDLRMREEREKMRKVGMIVGVIIAVVIIFAAKDFDLVQRIPLGIALGWTFLNIFTYQGRYHPKIICVIKISYPLLLLILFWVLTDTY